MRKCLFDDTEIKNYWSFAPFECYANSILSLMKLWDIDTSLFFAQYWFLSYDQLLLSAKHPRLNYMEQYYNLEYRFYISHNHTFIDCLDDDAAVMLYCDTKSLFYYPHDYTGGADFGLMHFIILYGYNSDEQLFYILDPTVDFIGTLSYQDVDNLIAEIEYQIFIRVKKTPSTRPVENKIEFFKRSSRQSYLFYHLAEKNCGLKAPELFINDLEVCESWDNERWDTWSLYNCVSLTSIIRNRNAIWNGLSRIEVLTSFQLERCHELFTNVSRDWNSLNFLMTKFRMKKDYKLIENLKTKLHAVQHDESVFLEELYRIGKTL